MVVVGVSSSKNFVTIFAGILIGDKVFTLNMFLDVARLALITTISALPLASTKIHHL